MDRAAILAKVLEILRDTLDLDPEFELTEATSFKELGADSFDLLELVTTLEDEFGRTMDDDSLETIETVGDAVDAIESAQ